MRIDIAIIGLMLGAADVFAQANVCTTGPGAPLGVRGYTCASCSLLRVDDGPLTHVFGTEPTVTEAPESSAFKAGDVITTINGRPITSREGAQDFGFPKRGKNDVGLRRWDGTTLWNVMVHVTVGDDCQPQRGFDMEMKRMAALAKEADRVSKIPPPPQSPDPTSRVGFAVSCTPSCSKVTDKQGVTFWKHEGYPEIVAVRAGSPAAEAGVMRGDLITEVDGISVTDEAGSRKLHAYATIPGPAYDCFKCEVPFMRLATLRNGVRREMTIIIRDKPPATHGPPPA